VTFIVVLSAERFAFGKHYSCSGCPVVICVLGDGTPSNLCSRLESLVVFVGFSSEWLLRHLSWSRIPTRVATGFLGMARDPPVCNKVKVKSVRFN
jgi:hypothetical protein